MSLSQTKLLVFARAPIAGRCKTRLIAKYGKRGAARIHRELVLRTLRTAGAHGAPCELWCEPSARHAFFLKCRREFGVALKSQPAGDLGRKMALALVRALDDGSGKVLIVGTDCPALTVADLQAAAAALDRHDVVLQPAEDGGYVLIGARRFAAGALRNIFWSSGLELAQTRRGLARLGFSVAPLAERWDVDWPADVGRARQSGFLV
ncbi:MAG TPA: TIGR04282 family arsenosugar biosynthesis glycosyltransferase [Nevskiaceae bacterium]|nr:TIGR04282 family arsenosugar biosynthesis glycosyltransferase [Nevskiaceae bacterium]